MRQNPEQLPSERIPPIAEVGVPTADLRAKAERILSETRDFRYLSPASRVVGAMLRSTLEEIRAGRVKRIPYAVIQEVLDQLQSIESRLYDAEKESDSVLLEDTRLKSTRSLLDIGTPDYEGFGSVACQQAFDHHLTRAKGLRADLEKLDRLAATIAEAGLCALPLDLSGVSSR